MNKPQNPFTVISPERLSAVEAKQLFVKVFTDFPQMKSEGNSIMFGSRGSGKSMMLRCLMSDVILPDGGKIDDLDFLSFLISVKNTELKITELEVLEESGGAYMINEHFFIVTILVEILNWLANVKNFDLPYDRERYELFHNDIYRKCLRFCRYKGEVNGNFGTAKEYFQSLHDHAMLELHGIFKDYILSLPIAHGKVLPSYKLPLLSFARFLSPFLKGVRDLLNLAGKNVYLLIDDADNLSVTQTRILNSWIIARTQPEISIKVSSQVSKYKSFMGTNRVLVETPHDYHEIRISERYTNSKNTYYKRVEEIINKRLILAGIERTALDYFPVKEAQEQKIEEEAERLKSSWSESGRGYRPGDDALRYARPNYIRDLGGEKKSRSTYAYAGFFQLVNLSSGVIRNFLDAASTMYEEEKEANVLSHITYGVQDSVMRGKAYSKMFAEFPKLAMDFCPHAGEVGKAQKLQNLVFAMGRTFYDILVSDLSERRVFSIALTNIPDEEIKEVLDFGVQTGYFYEASVGNKEGTGKTWLYILNRMLAPQFNLDPNGFSGYLFVTNEALRSAIYSGKKLRDIKSGESDGLEQLNLFD